MKRQFIIGAVSAALLITLFIAAYAAAGGAKKEGMVEYIGAQKDIFVSGKAASVISLEEMAGQNSLYAIGPVDDLDGEITIFDSKPYITKVKGHDYYLTTTFKVGAFFLVWTEQSKWKDIPVPSNVKGYVELQDFVKKQALAEGIDVTKPFPFLLSGTPVEIRWHININRTEGKSITKELFAKSKEHFITKNEFVDIIGFYSEHHAGVFLTKYAPAIAESSGMQNAIHIHFVSRESKASGHIDDLTLGKGMVLHLPNQ